MFKFPLNVGIDISDYKLRLVALRRTYRRYELNAFGEVDLPTGVLTNGIIIQPEALTAALKTLAKHLTGSRVQERVVRAGLPEQQSFITTVAIGTLAKDEVIREVIKSMPFHKDEMYFDIDIDRTHKTASIAAGRKEFIDGFITTLEAANYHLVGIHVEADAIVQALFNSNTKHYNPTIVIDIGYARTSIIFFLHGKVYFTTSYPPVLNTAGLNEQNLAAVLQQIIGFYNEHYVKVGVVQKIVLCGSGAYLENISQYITQVTGIPAEPGNPFISLRENHLAKKMQSPLSYTTAIGLALAQ